MNLGQLIDAESVQTGAVYIAPPARKRSPMLPLGRVTHDGGKLVTTPDAPAAAAPAEQPKPEPLLARPPAPKRDPYEVEVTRKPGVPLVAKPVAPQKRRAAAPRPWKVARVTMLDAILQVLAAAPDGLRSGEVRAKLGAAGPENKSAVSAYLCICKTRGDVRRLKEDGGFVYLITAAGLRRLPKLAA